MKNFIQFIRSRGIIGFAVGFIMGKTVSDLVNSFVSDLINPVIGVLIGNFKDLSDVSVTVFGSTIKYGNFIVTAINFVLIAFAVYILFKVFKMEKFDAPNQ